MSRYEESMNDIVIAQSALEQSCIIEPFMQRNGFRDAAGWWVKRKDIRAK